MLQIRRGVFETNSSSVHSLTMCSKEEYKKWENGEVLLNDSWSSTFSLYKGQTFVPADEIRRLIAEKCNICVGDDEEIDDELMEQGFYTEDAFWNQHEEFEGFYETYRTKSGEEVVSFGYYGEDR